MLHGDGGLKMCEYCEFDNDGETLADLSNKMVDGGVFGYIDIRTLLNADNKSGKNARLLTYVGNTFDDIEVQYCPMCGRKLESDD